MYGFKRDKSSEVALPHTFFENLGLCQPVWITIQADDAYMHLALAFLSEEQTDDFIGLPPKLECIFSKDSQVSVSHYKVSSMQSPSK
jgi:hypothetical protein